MYHHAIANIIQLNTSIQLKSNLDLPAYKNELMSSYCNGTSGRINLMIFIGITIATAAQQWWIDRKLHYKAC
uniref:Uncharacterized protein n=1 Tax=Amphimedon queenslandica TaxID=400682 RepID=A0A1X7TIQ8_AMPQE